MKHLLTLLALTIPLFISQPAFTQDNPANVLADKVVEAMGGTENWNNTRYLQWNFFGSRMWWWDKWTGNVRVESQRNDLRIAMNINDKTGNVYMDGQEQTHQDSLSKYLERGYRMWINDAYWLVMPFKLRDPGTNLVHLGQKSTMNGEQAEVLELTFVEVGVTPQNKYWIYIDPASNLVVQWDYYRNADDTEPRLRNPWGDYKQYGDILLSGDRGERDLIDIAVHKKLPQSLFKSAASTAEEIIR